MHLDVLDLRAFYYRTKLGRAVQREMQGRMREFWPSTRGEIVVGFGFAAPFLRPFLTDAERVLSLMPAQQGVMPWPWGERNRSALVEETAWPLPAGAVDKLILAHGLETCEQAGALLEEIHRVLAPQGRALFIVPSRTGAWARRDATPFGYGRPYSSGQLDAQLRRHRFLPERHAAALYFPPSHRPYWLKSARMWEGLGRRLSMTMLAGSLMVEAGKQVFATPKGGERVVVPSPLDVLGGLTQPTPEPATGRRVRAAEQRWGRTAEPRGRR